MTDLDLVLKWLEFEEHNRGRQPGTATKYLNYLQRLIRSLEQKGKTLLIATREDLEEFTGLEAHKAGMLPRSRRPLVAAVKGFFRWARAVGLVDSDPGVALPYPKAGRRLPKGMDLGNAEKLMLQPDLDTFIGVRDAAILSVFMGCGLRLSEVCRLNERDLIFATDPGTDIERLVLRIVGKGDKQRFLPAPHETRLLIRAYLGHPDLQAIDRRLPDGDQVLFVSTNCRTIPAHEYYGEARRIAQRTIADAMEKYGRQAGIPRNQCNPHSLRHLFGTELAEDDTQMVKMQALMGHADTKTTADYAHVAMRSLSKVVDKSNPLAKMRTPVTDLAKAITRR